MIGTEDHFRRTLGPQGAGVLVKVIATSVVTAAEIESKNGFTEARTTPTVAYDLAKTALNAELEGAAGVQCVCRHGQNFWILDGVYALRIKKLDRNYRPTNHESVQQSAISGQQPLDDELVDLVHVTAGAHFSPVTGLADQYVVVKHSPSLTNRHQAEWVVDLQELASGEMGPLAPILPIVPVAPVAPAAIVRRAKQKDETGEARE